VKKTIVAERFDGRLHGARTEQVQGLLAGVRGRGPLRL
jgi:hypothetical protein